MSIKKYLLLVLVLVSTNTFAYRPGSIGISTRFGGAVSLGDKGSMPKGEILGLSTTVLEFYARKRTKWGYTPYIQVRLSTPFKQEYMYPANFLNEFRWGFLFGGSTRVLNKINPTTGIGWSLLLDGGMILDMPSISRFKVMVHTGINTPVNLGVELNLKAVYNMHKYAAITFGFNIGYELGYSIGAIVMPSIYHNPPKMMFDHAMIFGFNVGLLF